MSACLSPAANYEVLCVSNFFFSCDSKHQLKLRIETARNDSSVDTHKITADSFLFPFLCLFARCVRIKPVLWAVILSISTAKLASFTFIRTLAINKS